MRMMLNPFATNKYWWTCDVTKRGPGARRGLSVLLMTVLHQKDILKTSLHWKNQLGKPYTWYSSPPMGGLNLPLKPSFVKSITCSVVTCCCDTKIMINSFQIPYHAWLQRINSLNRPKKKEKKNSDLELNPLWMRDIFPAARKSFFTICQ